MAPDNEVFSFIRDWLWAPLLGLVTWAWNRNEKEHDMLRSANEALRTQQSNGYSSLNDRVMEHVDEKFGEVKADHGKRMDKINDHIAKLFENAEKDRAAFRDALADHAAASNERHIQLMQGQSALLTALHTGLAGKADK